jgi:site-specific DNA recombinase
VKSAIYCRVSTEDQEREGTSLISQRQACLVKAKEAGYEVPGDFIFSEAWTGTDTDRPKLNELRQMIRDRLLDAVICYSTDRLARNPIHIAIVAEECQKRDIRLIFVTEPLDDSPEGQLIRYVKGYAAQIEHEKIRERTTRGKKTGVLSGRISTGSPQLFGYHQENGKRIIVESEAEIVRDIFNRIAVKGNSPRQVAIDLNLAGIPAPRGGKWYDSAIYRMIKNPAYVGITYAYRTMAVVPVVHKVNRKRSRKETSKIMRKRSEWVKIPDVTPAIISEETFTLIEKQLEKNRHKTPHNKVHSYLFNNGRLRCGVCGRSMVASASERKYGFTYVYRCISNTKPHYYGKCGQKSINAGVIEPFVWSEISRILTQPEIVLAEIEKQKASRPVTLEADQILIENNIANARTEEQRYLRQYGKGLIDEIELKVEILRVKRYREQQEAKLAEIEDLVKAYEQVSVNYQQYSQVLKTIARNLQNAGHDIQQLTLEALNISITLHPDRTITINGAVPESVLQTNCTGQHAGLHDYRPGSGGDGGSASRLT